MKVPQFSELILPRVGQPEDIDVITAGDVLTPADRYQELFVAVQNSRIFADSKNFVDCVPRIEAEEILRRYRALQARPGFVLAQFVAEHFYHEPIPESHYVSNPNQPLSEHIDGLWDVLTRRPSEHPARTSLLPLPYDYIVPGGRFTEMYYWDSYFTMLGLAQSGRPHLLRSMADNFAFLIDTYGHIPNGNRSYYLSRSQPPVFALMVDLLELHGIEYALQYLPQLQREYAYWMEGAESLLAGQAHRHVVRLPDGSLLNRYWDDRNTPREEAYLEDVTTAAGSLRPASEVYRDLRAGAASGWDYSSRWLGTVGDLSSIRTTAILPVDLNSFLYKLEQQITHLSRVSGDVKTAAAFQTLAKARYKAINHYLWSDAEGFFVDYDWQLLAARQHFNAATVVPLYIGIASDAQAFKVGQALQTRLLASGGLATTEYYTGQQWDQPNGWAPLQWMAIGGLQRYGQEVLSGEIARRWLATVGNLYERECKIVEKYALHAPTEGARGGGGGEYPLQDGFGWTNGVTRRLLHDHPSHHAHHCRAGRKCQRS